jgi:hypothetical protein
MNDMKNMLLGHCAKCEAKITVGEDFIEIGEDRYCTRCAKKRNVLKEWFCRVDSEEREDVKISTAEYES